jgi:hypothetical protein
MRKAKKRMFHAPEFKAKVDLEILRDKNYKNVLPSQVGIK